MTTTTALHALSVRELRLAARTAAGRALLDWLVDDRPRAARPGGSATSDGAPVSDGDDGTEGVDLVGLLQEVAADQDRRRRWHVASRIVAFGAGGAVGVAALLVVLGPELGVARHHLVAAGIDLDLADSEIVGALLEAIEALPTHLVDGAAPAFLVRRVDVAVRRAARAWRREAGRKVTLDDEDDWASEGGDPALVVSTLLAEAAAAEVLSVRQASLVQAVRIADGAPAAVARSSRRTERAVRMELVRAEAALRSYLSSTAEARP